VQTVPVAAFAVNLKGREGASGTVADAGPPAGLLEVGSEGMAAARVAERQSAHFDPRMGSHIGARRRKKALEFVEPGSVQAAAAEDRAAAAAVESEAEAKAKALREEKAAAEEKLKKELEERSRRPPDPIPEVEWWDKPFLKNGTYDDVRDGRCEINWELVTHYVEHPVPIEPPAECEPPPPQPLKMTKKETRKMRKQARAARVQEQQEMQRQGLVEAPKPKVKLSNLMRVLGSEATADPTAVEKEVRAQMEERLQAHADMNEANKLTPAERREKKLKKLFSDNEKGTFVSVYRVERLDNPRNRYKVDINAQENHLTGAAVTGPSFTTVVVEGCQKSQKRYGKLMTRRIDWNEVLDAAADAAEDAREENKCTLVWQGCVAKPSFKRFIVETFESDAGAEAFLAKNGVQNYFKHAQRAAHGDEIFL